MTKPPTAKPRNRFLMALPSEILARLSPQLEPVALRRRSVLIQPGVDPPYVHFPEYGLVSVVKTMSDGRVVEVAALGPESIVGVTALAGMTELNVEALVQVSGSAHRLRTAVLRAEVDQSPPLKALVLRLLQYAISYVAQTAACNRLHTLRQRCCRWLLNAHDGVQAASFTLTHEFLALMMGVNRPRMSITLRALQQAGVIRYRYASVTILDRAALERGSCECYETLQHKIEEVYRR